MRLGPFHITYDNDRDELIITAVARRTGDLLIVPREGNAVSIRTEHAWFDRMVDGKPIRDQREELS